MFRNYLKIIEEIYAERGYKNTQFNPIKTWTEYANRLTGVTIGFLIFLTAWASRIYLKADKSIFLSIPFNFLFSRLSRLVRLGRGCK